MSLEEARSKLDLAKSHLERVRDGVMAEDRVEAVTWAFYAYESAVVAAAEREGVSWQKNHPSKAKAAAELHQSGALSRDVSETLRELNELRKDVAYGEAGPDLETIDLEDLEAELEEFVEEITTLIEGEEKNR